MKIVHIIYSFNTGGAETMLIDIMNEQVKTEDVTLIIINDSKSDCLIDNIDKRVNIVYLNRIEKSKSIIPLIRLNFILWHMKPQAIHVHNESICAVISPHISRALFLTVHDLRVSMKHVKRAKCLFAISDAVKDDILKRGKYNVKVIPNGINIEQIEKKEYTVASCTEKFRIVQVARLESDKKGQDILIDAISILKERGINNVYADFIGTGSSMEELLKQAQRKGVEEKIGFLGLRDRKYIYRHLKDYDLMCHPSRYEGFGLTVAEGIAAMLPVLVSDEGGPYEIINKGELGYSFRMEDAKDCADRIEYIMDNYGEAINITDKAYEHIKKHYSVERMVKEYIEAYKN